MKFSAVSLLVLGAGVAQHAVTNPIQVILTELTTFHPSAANNNIVHVDGTCLGLPMPHSFISSEKADELSKEAHRCPCTTKKYKGGSLSNAFRQAMGLPLIEKNISPEQVDKMVHGGILRIMPIHDVGNDEHQPMRLGKWHHFGDNEKKMHRGHHEHEHNGQLGRHGRHHAHTHAHGQARRHLASEFSSDKCLSPNCNMRNSELNSRATGHSARVDPSQNRKIQKSQFTRG
ncbi:hypothetical protein FIBSPDRAFT_966845 [Athelia psychrophila]|uniref:Uncharacterized protein n=1 Tax=Athelia psychrophila TaxID=1759441 RepID=A0A167WDD5_9AGAM|nr:hypothetical protein FIBSPDRAFT_966845 [Fibularhizoctonia sp. CBS 109695]